MSLIKFPYIVAMGKMLPLIPVQVKSGNLWHYCLAFVDSGATFSIFKKDEAVKMNIPFQDGEKTMVVVGDGSYIPVYIHTLSVRIGNWESTVKIGFSDRLGVGFNILGRKDIFEKLKVCFNDKDREVTFQEL